MIDELFRDNPVLTREVQLALGLRKQQAPAKKLLSMIGGWTFVAVIYGACFYLLYLANDAASGMGTYSGSRYVAMMLFSIIAGVGMLLHFFGPAGMTATTISSEREKQTWNAVLLSRLTNSQVLVGKLAGGLVGFFVGSAIFLPLLIILGIVARIPVGTFFAVVAMIVLTSCFSATLGVFVSWLSRNSKIASTTASGLVLALALGTGGLTLVLGAMIAYADYHHLMQVGDPAPYIMPPLFINPFYGLICILTGGFESLEAGLRNRPVYLSPVVSLVSVAFCVTTTVLMVRTLAAKLTRGHRDMTG